ncbi:868_t:CDS:2 [Diversispora eburnea]|uniref:868_t:CDS:1 n=1 Tax=Diversispora eburnea TaxID=1213867 RepID=A0A9N9CRM0_9GLOM|nr:868_t:CDS:2 [Diversispora eburnea]
MTKRSQSEQELFSLDSEIYQNKASSSKRVRFSGNAAEKNEYNWEEEEEIEFNHEESLEKVKRRRGGIKLEGYETDSDEDVSAELYNRRKGKGKATNVDDDMDDMFADDETSSSKKQSEFDFSGKDGPDLEFDEIDGQDFTSHDAYDDESGEPIIEAFNLKSELEEGRFDEAGNYIPHKDPNAFHDLWLEGVSRVDIEKARIAHEKQEKERKLKEAREDSNMPMDRVEICKELLSIMKRGEILSDTLQRLGGANTWEQILRKLKREGSWTDDSGGDVNEIYGPFSGEDMKAWKDQGYFVNGVMVRKVGSGNEFVSVTEIDF